MKIQISPAVIHMNGNEDVFTIPSGGGFPERITYHPANDQVIGFNPDGTLLFSTRRIYAQVEREYEVYLSRLDERTPERF